MRTFVRSFVAPALALGLFAVLGPSAAAADDSGPVLQPSIGGATVVLSPDVGCRTLLATGEGDCGVLTTRSGQVLFVIDKGEKIDDVLASRPWVVRVFVPDPAVADGWRPVLSTVAGSAAEPGPLFANVEAVATDLTGDGADELVLGYRSEGTGGFLNVEVLGVGRQGAPSVVLSTLLAKGVVDIRKARLVTHSAEHEAGDGNCCPTFTQRASTKVVDGELVLSEGKRLRTRAVNFPESDLG
jgi:hypothetical protein